MALAGIVSVGVFIALLRRFVSARAALLGGALAATSPVLIYYSQELKMYSLLALFLLLVLYEVLRCLDEPERSWHRLALWASLSVYTFYLSVIVWVGVLGMVAWQTRKAHQKIIGRTLVLHDALDKDRHPRHKDRSSDRETFPN